MSFNWSNFWKANLVGIILGGGSFFVLLQKVDAGFVNMARDITDLKTDISTLKVDFKSMHTSQDTLKQQVHDIRIEMNNWHEMQNLKEGYYTQKKDSEGNRTWHKVRR